MAKELIQEFIKDGKFRITMETELAKDLKLGSDCKDIDFTIYRNINGSFAKTGSFIMSNNDPYFPKIVDAEKDFFVLEGTDSFHNDYSSKISRDIETGKFHREDKIIKYHDEGKYSFITPSNEAISQRIRDRNQRS